jgi:ribosomal protein S12 methylthiotransferase accessory factor YcaO
MSDKLERRIASALTDSTPSAAVGLLIEEVETAISAANKTTEEARDKALDPTTADTSTARREMEEAVFCRDRLYAALPRLRERFGKAQKQEDLDAWLPKHKAAKTRRDALAVKLRERYLSVIEELVPLLLEIEQADAEVRVVNLAIPSHGTTGMLLHSVEEEARGRRNCGLSTQR